MRRRNANYYLHFSAGTALVSKLERRRAELSLELVGKIV